MLPVRPQPQILEHHPCVGAHVAPDQTTSVERHRQRAFRLALGRPPSAKETEAMSGYVSEHGLTNLCRLIYNLNEFNFVD